MKKTREDLIRRNYKKLNTKPITVRFVGPQGSLKTLKLPRDSEHGVGRIGTEPEGRKPGRNTRKQPTREPLSTTGNARSNYLNT